MQHKVVKGLKSGLLEAVRICKVAGHSGYYAQNASRMLSAELRRPFTSTTSPLEVLAEFSEDARKRKYDADRVKRQSRFIQELRRVGSSDRIAYPLGVPHLGRRLLCQSSCSFLQLVHSTTGSPRPDNAMEAVSTTKELLSIDLDRLLGQEKNTRLEQQMEIEEVVPQLVPQQFWTSLEVGTPDVPPKNARDSGTRKDEMPLVPSTDPTDMLERQQSPAVELGVVVPNTEQVQSPSFPQIPEIDAESAKTKLNIGDNWIDLIAQLKDMNDREKIRQIIGTIPDDDAVDDDEELERQITAELEGDGDEKDHDEEGDSTEEESPKSKPKEPQDLGVYWTGEGERIEISGDPKKVNHTGYITGEGHMLTEEKEEPPTASDKTPSDSEK